MRKRDDTICVLLATIPYLEMPLLLFHMSSCGLVHSGSYPGTAVERVVVECAGVALHEESALLMLEMDGDPPRRWLINFQARP